LATIFLLPVASAQDQEPADLEVREEVEVNLVIVDTLVVDKQGRTVGDLTREDFLLSVQGRAQEIDTFDVICPDPGQGEPKAITLEEQREPVGPEPERRLVLAFDYYNLQHANRAAALQWGKVITSRDMQAGDGIMIVALADGLRIEQRFTGSPVKVLHTLERMEHDTSLYGREFGSITPRSFLDNLAVLADVLAQYPGPKSVVLFSEWMDRADDWDIFFQETAEHAAAARMTIYPVWAPGLEVGGPTGGSPTLARLANESGGRFTRNVNDLSMAYVLARRDLACRYAIGFYVDPEGSQKGRRISVRVKNKAYSTRAPERARLFSEAQRRDSMLRAAFADPGPNESPLLRAHAYPFRPLSNKAWEAFFGVSFPLYLEETGASRVIGASLDAAHLNIETVSDRYDFPAPGSGEPGVRPITLYGLRKIKPGPHTFTVVVAEPDSQKISTAQLDFSVPDVPQGELVVRGPLLARVDPEGIRMRVDDQELEGSKLDDLIGDAGFVPLLVSHVEPSHELIAAWAICSTGAGVPSGARVERRVRAEGEIVHQLDPVPLDLQGKKKLACQSGLDKLPANTLEEGKYRFEVAVVGAKGDAAMGLRPFMIDVPPLGED
jgi:VWFA-related protein